MTHVLRRAQRIRIPKASYTSLSIPVQDSSTEEKNLFASTFLANWTSDRSPARVHAQGLPDWSPWAELEAWKASDEREVRSSLCLMQRFHEHTLVTAEKRNQAKARRPVPVSDAGFCGDANIYPASEDEYDYDTDHDLDVTPDMMNEEMASLSDSSGARGFLKGALQIFGDVFPTPTSTTPLGVACVDGGTVKIRAMVAAATKRNEELSGQRKCDNNGQYLELHACDGVVSALLVAATTPPLLPVVCSVNVNDPEQIPALFTPLKDPPTIQETIALFTLASGQAQMFILLATEANEVLRREKGIASPEKEWFSKSPLRLLVLGPPGTGKTRAQLAFQWYAYQHGIHERILLTAYPHKAAALLNSPILTASTTCAMMGIDPVGHKLYTLQRNAKAHAKSQTLLHDGRWLIMDEASFFSLSTLALTSHSLRQNTLYRNGDPSVASHFGAIGVVLTGDLTQHTPPCGKPLFAGCAWETDCIRRNRPDIRSAVTANADDVYGREAFKSFSDVLILGKQHRMMGDPAFAAMTATFASEDVVTPQQIDDFCELINTSVPASIYDLLPLSPRVVVTRNDVKNHIARALDIAQV